MSRLLTLSAALALALALGACTEKPQTASPSKADTPAWQAAENGYVVPGCAEAAATRAISIAASVAFSVVRRITPPLLARSVVVLPLRAIRELGIPGVLVAGRPAGREVTIVGNLPWPAIDLLRIPDRNRLDLLAAGDEGHRDKRNDEQAPRRHHFLPSVGTVPDGP
jgi:hypothetical protein